MVLLLTFWTTFGALSPAEKEGVVAENPLRVFTRSAVHVGCVPDEKSDPGYQAVTRPVNVTSRGATWLLLVQRSTKLRIVKQKRGFVSTFEKLVYEQKPVTSHPSTHTV